MVAISLLTPLTNSQTGDGITVLCSSLPLQTFLLPKSAHQSFVSYIITLFPSSLFVTVISTEPPVLTSLPSFHKDFCSWLIATLEKVMAPHSSTLAWKVPVQVRCTILDAWGWCTGTTQRAGMGREDGGGFRMVPSLGFSRQEHWSGLPFPSPMHESEK